MPTKPSFLPNHKDSNLLCEERSTRALKHAEAYHNKDLCVAGYLSMIDFDSAHHSPFFSSRVQSLREQWWWLWVLLANYMLGSQ